MQPRAIHFLIEAKKDPNLVINHHHQQRKNKENIEAMRMVNNFSAKHCILCVCIHLKWRTPNKEIQMRHAKNKEKKKKTKHR